MLAGWREGAVSEVEGTQELGGRLGGSFGASNVRSGWWRGRLERFVEGQRLWAA